MKPPAYNHVANLAHGVGILIDRCARQEAPIGTVWLVDDNTVATCAHLVLLYEDFLRGLKVSFPAAAQTWEVTDVVFHPRFDRRAAKEMAERSLSAPVPALALQDHNVALLKLTQRVSHLGREEATQFNKKIAAVPTPRLKGLAGAVDEIGLELIFQTVSNTRKDGLLVITDERNRPIARLQFRDGKISHAKFGKLNNEMALYQLFQQSPGGQFQFRANEQPDWQIGEPMSRNTESLLLEAHRRLDECGKLLERLGGPSVAFVQSTDALDTSNLPPDTVPAAERLWPLLDGGLSVDQLWEVANMDNYSIYASLVELAFARQITEAPAEQNGSAPVQTLDTAAYELLCPWDEVVSLTVHPSTGRPQMRRGHLVGLLRPNDPYHLLHTLDLPYRAAGSPILKNGKVIGMHCGMLPLDPTLHALPRHLHQMLWVDSVNSCLSEKTKRSLEEKKSVGMVRFTEAPLDGRIICPKCQASMVKDAKFCGTCGQKL
jgi:hypothetical protein